ncbi:protein kinase [Streptomyces sp. ISL-98]|uniref:protein kinase n=1 Tax=Streptomyces sp. ISL-98 TaxID=2819192 RepID=UPI001BE7FAAC|nr:protein kinase [Streptomyces sp. ISL-98]MBT2507131.1 protein kinase [Streptomyces sp. ISL-98]
MDDYAGRVLADRYRLPLPPSDEYELVETRAFDTYSGQEVLVRQVPLPEVVDAEFLDGEGGGGGAARGVRRAAGRTTRRPTDPAVRRAIEAAQAAAQIPDHPRLDQVFDVFAEGGSLWIVSELVAARPLAALLAERPLNPYRAAEIAADVLTALRVLHAHGWTHRNITVRTVLVCDDGRIVLTGLAAGAAEEALCGYAPVPVPAEPAVDADEDDGSWGTAAEPRSAGAPGHDELSTTGGVEAVPYAGVPPGTRAALPSGGGRPGANPAADVRAARAGAIAAYRAGARAAARVSEEQRPEGTAPLPAQRPALRPAGGPRAISPYVDLDADTGTGTGAGAATGARGALGAGGGWHSGPGGPGASAGNESTASAGGRTGAGADFDETWHGAVPRSGAGDGLRADGLRHAHPREQAEALTPTQGYAQGQAVAQSGTQRGVPAQARPGAPGSQTQARTYAQPFGGQAGQGRRGENAGQGAHAGQGGQAGHSGQGPASSSAAGRWDEYVAGGHVPAHRGPANPLAAERARQARIAVVGAVTERWAPEQAGSVHGNWQLAPPIGPSTDLWALGALLFRTVQGHAPYPEDSAIELVQLVCAEPPAFAEECGPLRPVVESLLRQDPTERPDFEELRGWLRSLVRSAPEPEAGVDVVPLPSVDSARLPIVRRRGELVRKRRGGSAEAQHGRHRHKKAKDSRNTGAGRENRREKEPRAAREPRIKEPRIQPKQRGGPRSLGRTLLVVILLGLVAALVYALVFMPKAGEGNGEGDQGDAKNVGDELRTSAPPTPGPSGGTDSAEPPPQKTPDKTPSSQQPQTSVPASDVAKGYAIRKDPEGFQTAVDKDWERRPINDAGQVRYRGGGFELVIVPGRDTVKEYGSDPMDYQLKKERELQAVRDSSWSTSNGLRRIDVGRQVMAEGQFTWQDSSGRDVYVRNLAIIVGDRYHVVQVIGPESQRDKVTEIYEQASSAYRVTG